VVRCRERVFPQMLFWVLPKRSIPKPDQHRKDIIHQESLGTDMS